MEESGRAIKRTVRAPHNTQSVIFRTRSLLLAISDFTKPLTFPLVAPTSPCINVVPTSRIPTNVGPFLVFGLRTRRATLWNSDSQKNAVVRDVVACIDAVGVRDVLSNCVGDGLEKGCYGVLICAWVSFEYKESMIDGRRIFGRVEKSIERNNT